MASGEWNKAKKEIRRFLSERAKLRGMMPYSELASKVQAMDLESHDFRLFQLLSEISTEEDSHDRGMLSVIVVHKQGYMQPGPGFFELSEELGRDTTDVLECWVHELKKVHGYWRGNEQRT